MKVPNTSSPDIKGRPVHSVTVDQIADIRLIDPDNLPVGSVIFISVNHVPHSSSPYRLAYFNPAPPIEIPGSFAITARPGFYWQLASPVLISEGPPPPDPPKQLLEVTKTTVQDNLATEEPVIGWNNPIAPFNGLGATWDVVNGTLTFDAADMDIEVSFDAKYDLTTSDRAAAHARLELVGTGIIPFTEGTTYLRTDPETDTGHAKLAGKLLSMSFGDQIRMVTQREGVSNQLVEARLTIKQI